MSNGAAGGSLETLQKGDGRFVPGGSDAVRELQRTFSELGYPLGPERGSGVYGTRTEGAVAYFQRKVGLEPASGTAGRRTRLRLREALADLRDAARGDRPAVSQAPRSFAGEVKARASEASALLLTLVLCLVVVLPGRRRTRSAWKAIVAPLQTGSDGAPRRLGEYLVASGAVAPSALDRALREQARGGGRLGVVLQATGAVAAAPLRSALAARTGLGTVGDGDVPTSALPPGPARRLRAVALAPRAATDAGPRRRFSRAVPAEAPTVAFGDPSPSAVADVERRLGRRITPVVADDRTLDELLVRAYAVEDRAAVTEVLPGRRGLRRTAALTATAVVLISLLAATSPVLALLVGCLVGAGLNLTQVRRVLRAAPSPGAPVAAAVPTAAAPQSYTVVVPCWAESSSTLRTCMEALGRLDHPPALLHGVAVVASTDHATRSALATADLPPWMVEVVVDVRGPEARTALALSGIRNARGSLCAVVDPRRPPAPDHLSAAASRWGEPVGSGMALRFTADGGLRPATSQDLLRSWRRPVGAAEHFETATFERDLGWEPGVPPARAVGTAWPVPADRVGAGSVWVCVPTYDEADNVEALCLAALDSLQQGGIDGHVLVVDDGSPDGTGRIADALAAREPRLHVLHRTAKEGIGPAYVAGFAHALEHGADLVLEMDCDFSHDPRAIPTLVAAAARADVVLGSRYVAGGRVENWPLARRMVSRGGSAYARRVLGLDTRDLTGGFKVLRRSVLETLPFDELHTTGYGFQVEVTFRAVQAGYRVAEVPITFRDRTGGTSKMSKAIAIEAAVAVLRLRRARRGLRAAAAASPPRLWGTGDQVDAVVAHRVRTGL